MASVGDVTVELRAGVDQLERDLRAGQRHIEGFTQRAGSAFSRLGASVITLNQAVQLGNTIGRTFGAAFHAVIRAAGEAQQAVAALDQTLRSTGQYTRGYSDELRALAARLMVLTGNSDEAILGVERQLVAFGATRKQIEPLTRAVLDLSTGMGRDLNGAALLVGRALAGNFTMLGRMGIAVDENASSAVKLDQALGAIARRFGGQAEAQARTYEGRMRVLSELFGELEESIGGAIVNSQSFDRVLGRVQALVTSAGESTAQWVDANRALIDLRIEQVFTAIGDAAEALPGHIATAADTIVNLGAAWSQLPPELKGMLVGGALGGVPGAIGGAAVGAVSREGLTDWLAHVIVQARVGNKRISEDVQKRLRRRQSLSYDPLLDFKLANIRADREIGGQFVGPMQPVFVGPPEFVGLPEPPWAGVPSGGTAAPSVDDSDGASKRVKRAEDTFKIEEALARVKASQEGMDEARVTRAETQVALAERALDIARASGKSTEQLLALAEQLDAAERARAEAQSAALDVQIRGYDVTAGEAEALHAQIEKINAELAAGPTHVQKLAVELGRAAAAGSAVGDAFKRALSDVVLGTALGTGDIKDTFSRLAGSLGQRLIEPAVNQAVESAVGNISSWFGSSGAPAGGFVGPPTAAQAAAAGSSAPPAASAGGGTGSAAGLGGLGGAAGGIIGAALIILQGIISSMDAAKRVKETKLGVTQKDLYEAARSAFPLGKILAPPYKMVPSWALQAINPFTGGMFHPPNAEQQLSGLLGKFFKQQGIPGVPALNRLNLRGPGRGGPQRGPGFEAGGQLDLAALSVGLQISQDFPELPERRFVPGRTRNAILNTLSDLGLSSEDARKRIGALGRSLNETLDDALIRFNRVRLRGDITQREFGDFVASAVINFNQIPPAIDASALALMALGDTGALTISRLERTIADATATITDGVRGTFEALVDDDPSTDAAQALGDRFGETFKARVAERLLQSESIGRALTQAAVLAERLAEARAMGDTEAASTLQAQLRDVYTAAQTDYLDAVTPIALAAREDLRIFDVVSRKRNGVIDEANLTLPRFATGGTVPGPYGTPRLAVVHGGEHVYTPHQSEQITGLLTQMLGAMRRGASVHVTVEPASVQIDGRDLVAAIGRTRILQHAGSMLPEAIGLRR